MSCFSILNLNLNCISIFSCIDFDFYSNFVYLFILFEGSFYIGLTSKLPFLEVPFFFLVFNLYI